MSMNSRGPFSIGDTVVSLDHPDLLPQVRGLDLVVASALIEMRVVNVDGVSTNIGLYHICEGADLPPSPHNKPWGFRPEYLRRRDWPNSDVDRPSTWRDTPYGDRIAVEPAHRGMSPWSNVSSGGSRR